jgi:haloalkane dehalogenase
VSDDVAAAYDAPFPDETYKAGPRQFPLLVPTAPDDPATEANRAAWKALCDSTTPMLVAFSDSDPVTGALAPILARTVPGAKSVTLAGGAHFLQEDVGAPLGEAIVDFVRGT